jgi:hypothetical protein
MAEMAHVRGMTIASYLSELAILDFEQARNTTFTNTAVLKPVALQSQSKAAPKVEIKKQREQNDGVRNQRILFLLAEGLDIPAIATRLNVGKSTVRRIQDERKNSEIRVYGGQRRTHQKWDERVRHSEQKIRGEATA